MIARKKRILIIVIIITFILIAILGGVYAFLYFKTDVLKSDQELFYKYISKNSDIINLIDSEWMNQYKNKIMTTTYTDEGKISFSISDSISDETQEQSQLNTMINNTKISFSSESDLSNGKVYEEYKILYNMPVQPTSENEESSENQENNETQTSSNTEQLSSNEQSLENANDSNIEEKELFNVKFLKQDELYGLKTDEIVTKYVSVRNSNIKELYNRLGIKDQNNTASQFQEYDLNTILNMSEEMKSEIQQRYMNVLNSHIQSSSFSKEKDARVTIDNDVYVANKYSLKLTGDEVINIKIKLLEALLNDQTTLSEITKILQKDSEYIKVLKESIQNEIEEIRREPSNSSVTLQINVYELDETLLETEIITDTGNKTIVNKNSGNTQNLKIVDTQTMNGVIVTTYNVTRNTSENNNSILLNINTTENAREASNIQLEIVNTGNINSNNIQTDITVIMKDSDGDRKITYSDIKTFNEPVQIENLSEETVILNDMTIEYNKSLLEAIENRLLEIYSERAASVGLDSETLTKEINYAIKTMREQFNRDEFEKQVQRSLNYVKQDAAVDLEFIQKLQNASTAEQVQKVKEERLVKRLNEFGIKAVTDEETGHILIDSGYNYSYVYYIDYDKYTVTRSEQEEM